MFLAAANMYCRMDDLFLFGHSMVAGPRNTLFSSAWQRISSGQMSASCTRHAAGMNTTSAPFSARMRAGSGWLLSAHIIMPILPYFVSNTGYSPVRVK